MSVRRLAETSVQPASFAFGEAFQPQVETWIAKYPEGRQQSAVIPLLMLAQEQDGWVTKAAIERVADMLAMPYIRVLEVATFYTQFQLKPVGSRAHIQVCGTTPCMLRGSEALMEVCRSRIHHDQFHTNEAGTLSWEEVECLGACVNAPMVMIFKDTYEDLTPERLSEIIDAFEVGQGAGVPPGPQNGRHYAAPISGLTSLKDETAVLKETRDREKIQAVAAAPSATAPAPAAEAAPSHAARPKTHAPETDPSVKSPSPVKASQAGETAQSAEAPSHSTVNAEKASEVAEQTRKQRSHPGKRGAAGTAQPISDDPVAAQPKADEPVAAQPKPSLFDANRPSAMERPAAVDDLRLISGVGPKIEGILHSLGIFTYAQIAAWTQAEREWVDGYLNFRGRIERDRWIRQADALAKGGVSEYVRVFGKEPR